MPVEANGLLRELIEVRQREFDDIQVHKCAIIIDRFLRDTRETGRASTDGWIPLKVVMGVVRKQPHLGLPTDQPGPLAALIRATVDLRWGGGKPLYEWQEGGPNQSAQLRAYRAPGETVPAKWAQERERREERRGGGPAA